MKHFSKHNSNNHKTKQFPKRSMPGGSLPCDAVYTHTHTSAYLNSAVTAVALHPFDCFCEVIFRKASPMPIRFLSV